jgi:hypothetical protein
MFIYKFPSICLLIVVSFFMVGCSTPATVVKLDSDKEASVKYFVSKPDLGRVYFTNGKIIGTLNNIFNFNPVHRNSSDVLLNTIVIGAINYEDILVFDVPPGKYKISWGVRSTDLILKQTKVSEFEFTIVAGEIKILKGDFDQGAGNLLGTLYNPPKTTVTESDREFLKGKNFVAPQSCPSNLCK